MGLPEIIIEFQSKGVSAIRRSKAGILAVLTCDTTKPGGGLYTYSDPAQISADSHGPEHLKNLGYALGFGPEKLHYVYAPMAEGAVDQAATFALLDTVGCNILCAAHDSITPTLIQTYVGDKLAQSRNIKGVVWGDSAPNDPHMICLAPAAMTYGEQAVTMANLACALGGMLATTPLGESITYRRVPNIDTYALTSGTAESAIEAGKIVLVQDEQGCKIARGITSLTEVSPQHTEDMKKIKIVDAMDAIRTDITASLESNYIGKVRNDYDAKLLLAGAIQGYLEGLGGAVIDTSYDNTVSISYAGQRGYLLAHGVDVSSMSQVEILKANTGSAVFLEAAVRFVDAMEDIRFTLSI